MRECGWLWWGKEWSYRSGEGGMDVGGMDEGGMDVGGMDVGEVTFIVSQG